MNYLNEVVLSALKKFESFLIEKGEIVEVFFDDHVPYDARQIPHLLEAKRLMKFIDSDSIYFQFADMVNTNQSTFFKEDLSDFEDFST